MYTKILNRYHVDKLYVFELKKYVETLQTEKSRLFSMYGYTENVNSILTSLQKEQKDWYYGQIDKELFIDLEIAHYILLKIHDEVEYCKEKISTRTEEHKKYLNKYNKD